ncbi:hypothetical protein [Taklimakanibacter deserti]|uniref:hypothetical protein n=1 Tax=Taklimakanibacter deserti TaxID=2267839 RepID=UPI0013C478BA
MATSADMSRAGANWLHRREILPFTALRCAFVIDQTGSTKLIRAQAFVLDLHGKNAAALAKSAPCDGF